MKITGKTMMMAAFRRKHASAVRPGYLLIPALLLPLCSYAQAEDRYTITPRLVARALSNTGLQTADEQVSLPARIVASEPYPKLDVLSVAPGATADASSTIKLACHAAASCVPFFAMVSGLHAAPTQGAASGAAGLPQRKPEVAIRIGARAILVMDDQRAHIQVVVVSLENGALGKWIRVASPDHKQTYYGEVVSANQVRGNF